ncbi:chemotaxis protein CheD [bacterium]|nr:chemotaxis protein CheD [bacterium]
MPLLRAGMAEIVVGQSGDTLQALGLGSCIGLLMVDKVSHIGGMVHIMLPSSNIAMKGEQPPGKFADTGVTELLKRITASGALKTRLQVKMAGGADMFSVPGSESRLGVGQRNIEAVDAELKKLGLRVDARHVGGNTGRTFEVDLATLSSSLRMAGKPPVEF